jgi:hypothetical protein
VIGRSKRKSKACGWRLILELILNPAERRMLSVLGLDPAIRPAAAVGALAVLGDHALQSEQARVPE